jgi:hypothetical protein
MRRPDAFDKTVGMSQAPALTVQMLAWLDEQPRSYADALEMWKTSCPRLSIWEDALADGLLAVRGGVVTVTPAGKRIVGVGS